MCPQKDKILVLTSQTKCSVLHSQNKLNFRAEYSCNFNYLAWGEYGCMLNTTHHSKRSFENIIRASLYISLYCTVLKTSF